MWKDVCGWSGISFLKACCLELQVFRSPTKHTLSSMVSHFQKLFDVASLSGVYPRMNEVYTRLGEMANMTRNLRDVLDLGDLQLERSFRLLCSRNKMKDDEE